MVRTLATSKLHAPADRDARGLFAVDSVQVVRAARIYLILFFCLGH
jgi:hypothetical protein